MVQRRHSESLLRFRSMAMSEMNIFAILLASLVAAVILMVFLVRMNGKRERGDRGYKWFGDELKNALSILDQIQILNFTIWNLRRFQKQCGDETPIPKGLVGLLLGDKDITDFSETGLQAMANEIMHLYETDEEVTVLRSNYYELLLHFLDAVANGLAKKDLMNVAVDSAIRVISVKEYDLTVTYGTVPLESTFEIPDLEAERKRQFTMLDSRASKYMDIDW